MFVVTQFPDPRFRRIDDNGVKKTSPASACTVFVDDRNHHAGDNGAGGFCNYDKEEPVIVTCPLIRERWDRTDGLDCATAYLTRIAEKPTGCGLENTREWECIVQSKNATGLVGWWEGWASMAEAPKDPITVFDLQAGYSQSYWQAKLPHSYLVTSAWTRMGSYFLSCELPPVGDCGGANCLTSYKWVESVKKSDQ